MSDNTYGPAYEESRDGKRIEKQHEVIKRYMLSHGSWKTLSEIEQRLGYPQASISAQLRHLRKARFGGYRVEKRRRDDGGTWEYRVKMSPNGELLFSV